MSISALGGSPHAGRAFQPPSFSSLDTNNDGSITLDELEANAPGGASGASNARAQKLFSAMDSNGDGSVSADEKSAFDAKLQARHDHHAGMSFQAQQLASQSTDVFKATDTNGDGAVSLDEFSNDSAAKGIGSDALQQLFNMIDQNGDGSVSQDETTSFLNEVQQALNQNSPQQGAGGPPPPPPPDGGTQNNGWSVSTDLLLLAQNAYTSTANSTSDFLSTLTSLLTPKAA